MVQHLDLKLGAGVLVLEVRLVALLLLVQQLHADLPQDQTDIRLRL